MVAVALEVGEPVKVSEAVGVELKVMVVVGEPGKGVSVRVPVIVMVPVRVKVAVGVGEASVDEIDLINIRQATHLAMARAVRALATAPLFAGWNMSSAP